MNKSRTILIVEDEGDILDFVEMALMDEGYQTVRAEDGATALEILEELVPGLILLDMRMPRMNGWEFAEAYRQRPGAKAPILVMTAGRDSGDRVEGLGAAGYISKPFNLEDLIRVVNELLDDSGGQETEAT